MLFLPLSRWCSIVPEILPKIRTKRKLLVTAVALARSSISGPSSIPSTALTRHETTYCYPDSALVQRRSRRSQNLAAWCAARAFSRSAGCESGRGFVRAPDKQILEFMNAFAEAMRVHDGKSLNPFLSESYSIEGVPEELEIILLVTYCKVSYRHT